MNYSKNLKNRLKDNYGPWALVTGASSGIGREIAMRLAEAGLNVVLNARSHEPLEDIAQEISTRFGTATEIVAADLSTREGLDYLISETSSIDIGLYVASAGFGNSGLFMSSSLDDEINMLRLNCEAVLITTKHFSELFNKRGKGGIILLSSMVGFQGVPYAAHYAASKAYVQSLAEALRQELKIHNIDILAAAPGPVKTGFAKRSNMDMGGLVMTPDQVAVPILRALGRKTTVLPGLLTKFLVGSLMTVPRWAKIKIMSLVMSGMTKHQRIASN